MLQKAQTYALDSDLSIQILEELVTQLPNDWSEVKNATPKNGPKSGKLGFAEHPKHNTYIYIYWLVFSTPLKNISQLELFFPIYGNS